MRPQKSLASEIARLRPVTIDARRRDRIEAVIEHLVEALNLIDGDPDLEDGDEDRCEAFDDAPIAGQGLLGGNGWTGLPGNEEDAEPDVDDEDSHDREFDYR